MNTWKVSDDLTFTTSKIISKRQASLPQPVERCDPAYFAAIVDQAGALNATELRTKYQNNGIFLQEEANINDAVTLTAGVRFDNSSNNK